MGDSFSLEGFGYNCTIDTTSWVWDPVNVTAVNTVCGTQSWLVISGSGSFTVANIGNNCTAPSVGFYAPGQLSWFLSNGSVPCGATWVQTWATAGEDPYDYGPWYFESVRLQVNWSQGESQDEGALANSDGPFAMSTIAGDNYLGVQGVGVTMQPMDLYNAVAVGLGDNNPYWAANIVSHPPPSDAGIQCGSTVTFVPQSIGAITRSIASGFYGALSFIRTGYITGCSSCGSAGCVPQSVGASETWGYSQ